MSYLKLKPNGRHRPTTILATAIVATLLLTFFLPNGRDAAASPVQDTTVRCDPQTAVGQIGQPLAIDFYVEDVVDLYGADVRLSFDTTKMQVIDTNPDATGIQIEPLDTFLSPDFVVRQIADNTEGTIWYAVTQVNPSVEVSGCGPLARFTLQPLEEGTYTLPFTYQKIVKRTGVQIPATSVDCTVTFIEGTSNLITFLPMIIAN